MLKAKNQLLVSMAAFVLLAAGSAPARSADVYNGALEGVVKDASGKPVSGAFVRLKNAEKTPRLHGDQPGRRRFQRQEASRRQL